jgi:mRNA interferase RelE/StbE
MFLRLCCRAPDGFVDADGIFAQTIQTKITVLAADPYSPNNNATKLQGRAGYRLRVGDWRVLYELESQRLVVLDVKPRGGAYQ